MSALTAPPAGAAARPASALGVAAACWGVGAHAALLLVAVARLALGAQRGFAESAPGPLAWSLAALTAAAFWFFQGYLGFQRSFSPLVVARADHLARHLTPWRAALAPAYTCGLFHATPRRRRVAAFIFIVMPPLAVAIRHLPEPAHAIVALGVAVGLGWGLLTMLALAARAAAGAPPAGPLDLPTEAARPEEAGP